jgi:hypothetical protein
MCSQKTKTKTGAIGENDDSFASRATTAQNPKGNERAK